MKLYEIDAEIMNCIDAETGEIVDAEKLESLQMERERKIEGVALWVKNLKAEADALKAEKEAFAERESKCKAKVESLSEWLTMALEAKSFETPKVKVSFRPSEAVEITDESAIPYEFVRKKLEFVPDKVAIKAALKNNIQVAGAELKANKNIQIK